MYWDKDSGNIKSIKECKGDIKGGRLNDDRNTAKNSTKNKYFNSIDISQSGEFIIGGGNSKNICFYDKKSKVLLRRYAVTQNRSLDGI